MIKIVIAVLLICLSGAIQAQTYYVDATNGNDAWSGILPDASSGEGPWKSFNRVNHKSFLPNDSIRLKCGETWRESLIILGSGGGPITIGNYGANCGPANNPTINAAQVVMGWSSVSGTPGLYAAPIVSEMNQVFVDGQYLNPAKYPKNGFLTITADTQLCATCNVPYNYVTDNSLALTSAQVAGAYVHIRINDYIIDDFTADAYDASTHTISLSYPGWVNERLGYAISKGWGYYLTNKAWMLDTAGGWAYEGGQLYLRLPDGSSPANHLIEVSPIYSEGIRVTNQPVNIADLNIKNAGATGIALINPATFNATNLKVANSGDTGIRVEGHNTAATAESGTIQGCDVTNSARKGIYTSSQTNTTIRDNTVSHTGTIGWPRKSHGAIWTLVSDNNIIQNNIITDSGYIGIQIQYQENIAIQNALVKNNIVENSCTVLDDCAAIYMQGYGDARISPLPIQYSKILDNIVINSTGNPAGRPLNSGSAAEGIYLDDYTNQVQVSGNTVVNARWGVFLHNAFNNSINNNTTYHNRQNEIAMSESGNYTVSPKGVMHDNQVNNNIFFPLNSSSTILEMSNFGTSGFAFYDQNLYSDMYTEILARVFSQDYTFKQWQQLKGMDLRSALFSYGRILPFKVTNTLSGNQVINSSYDSNVSNWTAWNSTYAWKANCSISGGCLTATNQAASTSLATSNAVSITQNKTYLLEFKMSSLQDNQNYRVVVRRYNSPYESFGFDQWLSAGTAWKKYSFVFTANTTALQDARIDFQLEPGQTIFIDNVSIKEVTAENHVDTSNDSSILINKSAVVQAIECPDADPTRCNAYIDLSGNPVFWPITLAPYSSKIVVWSNNPFMDADRDGVPNSQDVCPHTLQVADANALGCAPTDLAMTISAVPDPVLMGDVLTYTIMITNQGSDEAGAVTLIDALPANLTLISTIPSQGSCNTTSPVTCTLGNLANGSSATVTIAARATSVGLMSNTASVTGAGLDSVPVNNSATQTTTVTSSDLTPSALVTSILDTSLIINDSVSNLGNGAAGIFEVGFYLSRDAIYQASTDTLICKRSVTSLGAGASNPASGMAQTSCAIPPVPAGAYYTIAVADSGGMVLESNESNNTFATTNPVLIGADVTPTAVSVVKSGRTVYVSDTVKNQGNRNTGTFTVAYFLSTNSAYESGTDLALASNSNGSGRCMRTVASLAAGAISNVKNKTCYRPYGVVSGTNYYVLAVDDLGNVIDEYNEGNNSKASITTIRW